MAYRLSLVIFIFLFSCKDANYTRHMAPYSVKFSDDDQGGGGVIVRPDEPNATLPPEDPKVPEETKADKPEEPTKAPRVIITYNVHISPLVYGNCVSCHNGQKRKAILKKNRKPLIDLRTYENVYAAYDKILVRLNDLNSPMPPDSSAIERQGMYNLFIAWEADGFQR